MDPKIYDYFKPSRTPSSRGRSQSSEAGEEEDQGEADVLEYYSTNLISDRNITLADVQIWTYGQEELR